MSVFEELNETIAPPTGPVKVVQGVISNSVTDSGDDLYVTIPAFDGGNLTWGPCPWSPASSLPTCPSSI